MKNIKNRKNFSQIFHINILEINLLPRCDGRCVKGPRTDSPQYADLRLLAIPPSYRRVAAYNLN